MRPPRTGPHLLTLPDVAARLAVSPRTVQRLVAEGELPVHRIGRAVRVAETDLTVFLARAREPAS